MFVRKVHPRKRGNSEVTEGGATSAEGEEFKMTRDGKGPQRSNLEKQRNKTGVLGRATFQNGNH